MIHQYSDSYFGIVHRLINRQSIGLLDHHMSNQVLLLY